MSKITLPAQSVPIELEGSPMDPIWYEKLQTIVTFLNYFSEVNFATMTTGQVLVWNATTKKFSPGAN